MVANFTAQTLQLDREQALRQLELLGDKPDKVYLTAFFPKGDPRTKGENRDKGRKASRLNYSEVEAWQAEGRGVYLVANGYGHGKEDVRLCRTIFYEHDNLGKDIQLTLWQTLGMPEPTFQVDSGGISIHNYWVLEEPIHPELWAFQEHSGQWKGLQADLLELADADRSLVNPNRVMRLAGAWYFTHDENGTHPVAQSRIVGGCGKRYSYAELRGIIPRWQPPLTRHSPHNQEACGEGLLDFRTVGHLLPHWDERGRKGWATFQCPVHTNDGAKHSTDQIHVNCNTGQWEAHCGCDRKLIYQAVCDMVGHKPSGRGYGGGIGSGGGKRRNFGGGSGGSGDGGDGGDGERKILKFPGLDTPDMSALACSIREILSQDLPPSGVQAAKIRIRAANPAISERELNQLWYAIELESDLEQTRSDRKTEVDELVKLGNQSLNLDEFLPADLAQPLNLQSERLNIRPEVCLTSLLVGASSLHKTQTELIMCKSQDFTVPPTIFAGLVSESGQKKSPVLKSIIKKPLSVLQREKRFAFQKAMAQYEKDIADWDKCKSSGERETKFPDGKPQKPRQRIHYFTGTTGEGLIYQYQAHPDNTLLALVDELAGLFASQNKYSGGRGSDRQDILSAFDGTGATILRADGTKADIDGLLLSIYGTIQPEVLKRLMKDCSDPDGQWARFLFVNQPLAASELPEEDSGSFDLTDRLLGYYRNIDELPACQYRLSREAYQRYRPVYLQLERLRVSHPNPGMRAVYSKMEGYIGRLALNLHILHELAAKRVPDVTVPLHIMEKAIALCKFYIGQVKLIHFNSDDSELAPHLVKLIDLSKRLESVGKDGWVKAKDYIVSFTRTKRPKADVARSWMREAEALGFGCLRGTGIHLEYHWNSDNKPHAPTDPPPKKVDAVDDWETKVDDLSTAETTSYQWVEKKVDKVDENHPSSPDGVINTQYSEIYSPNTVVETDISNGLSTLSTFRCDDHISSISAVDDLSSECLPEVEVSTFPGEVSDTQVEQYPNEHSKNDTDVATEAVNLQEAGNTQSPNTRVRFLSERFPHANLTGFKALCRDDSRKTIEAAIEVLSGETKERVRGFWQRIESRFAH
jgi:hypothetical protein